MADITVRQFAEEVGVSRKTAYEWAKKGKVKTYRYSPTCIRIAGEELERFRNEHLVRVEPQKKTGLRALMERDVA